MQQNTKSYVIRKSNNSIQYTLAKFMPMLNDLSTIANDDGTLHLRQKNQEDILAEQEEINTVMKGDQESAIQRAQDLQRPKKNEEAKEVEIELPDEWYLESDKKAYHGFVESDNSRSTSKYVLMLLEKNANGQEEFVVSDVCDRWYKFTPMRKKKELISAIEMEKKRKENLKKVNDKINKFDFVVAATRRQRLEEKALRMENQEARIKSEEGLDYDEEVSDDEGMIAPDATEDEKVEALQETAYNFFDDEDRDEEDVVVEDEDELGEGISDTFDDDDDIFSDDTRKRKAEGLDGRPTKRRRFTGSLVDDMRSYLEERGGKALISEVSRYFLTEYRSEDRQALCNAVKDSMRQICRKTKEGKNQYVVLK